MAQITVAVSEMFTRGPLAWLSDVSLARSGGGFSLAYCAVSFRDKQERWPNDYPELAEFVNQSGGYLFFSGYDRVSLNVLTNETLELHYVREGQTNETSLTMGPVKRN